MALPIIHLAFCFDGWVFGGYVRDIHIRKLDKFTDVDLMFPAGADIDKFLTCLGVAHTVEVVQDLEFRYGEMYMSPGIKRLVQLMVDNIMVDVCVFDGDIEDWKAERSTDFSCNLFYMSRTVGLGIRYIPDMYKYIPDPVGHITEMTADSVFERVWDSATPSVKDVYRILKRIRKLTGRGMNLMNEMCSENMWDFMDLQEETERTKFQDYISNNSSNRD
jgi:hypothetical protein